MIRGMIFRKMKLFENIIKDEEKAKELDPFFQGLIDYEKQLEEFQTGETGETSEQVDNQLTEKNNNLINKSNSDLYKEDDENDKKEDEKSKQTENKLKGKNNNLINEINTIPENKHSEDSEELENYKTIDKNTITEDNHFIEKNNNLINKSNFNQDNKALQNFKKYAPELKKFLNILPCVLKSNEENNIERYNSCFNEIPENKMKIYKENNFSIKELENKQNKSLIDDNDVSFGISMFTKSGNFKYQFNQKNNFNEHKSSIVIKR